MENEPNRAINIPCARTVHAQEEALVNDDSIKKCAVRTLFFSFADMLS